jgi:hypothetical protein
VKKPLAAAAMNVATHRSHATDPAQAELHRPVADTLGKLINEHNADELDKQANDPFDSEHEITMALVLEDVKAGKRGWSGTTAK